MGWSVLVGACALVAGLFAADIAAARFAVTSYHYDAGLTGWNDEEPYLNYTTVPGVAGGPQFQAQFTIPLDGLVFAQPLAVPNQVVTGDPNPGKHDVVYVATYNNTVYAIDPTRGTILAQRTLDPAGLEPCQLRSTNAGINGTPVIDLKTRTLYVIDVTVVGGLNAYYLHAISLQTLADVMPPVLVSADQRLSNGTTIYSFDAADSRQRAALAIVRDNIYAGFAAACETLNTGGPPSRGWLLGWRASTLQALPLNELTDRQTTSPNNFFHTSIWMSGAGIPSDGQNILFVTGNSDQSGTTYDSTYNLSESVVKISTVTNKVTDFFTPYQVATWDEIDEDFGSGGVMLVPPVTGAPPLATVAGKSGTMYLLNESNLGKFTPNGPDKSLDKTPIGSCWCAESAFQYNGSTYLVSSGGTTISVWGIHPSPTKTIPIASATGLPLSPHGLRGYFTTVSSNAGADPIIWAVTRSPSATTPMMLYAFQALPNAGSTTLPVLYSAPVGNWTYSLNANITPVVANGHVYVAGDRQLMIFGSGAP